MSNINVMRKNLGPVTAYKYAVQQGYTGTEQEFATLMASYATVAETATQAADDAVDAKTAAEAAQAAAEAAAEQAEGAIEVDDTLSVEGRAADAKVTGDEINKVKADLAYFGNSVDVDVVPVANLIGAHGNFENFALASNNWYKAYSESTATVTDNVLDFNANRQFGSLRHNIPVTEGNNYYYFGQLKTESASATLSVNIGKPLASIPNDGEFHFLSGIWTAKSSGTAYISITDSTAVSDQNTIYAKKCGVIDLTAIFGAGSEPTKEKMDVALRNIGNFVVQGYLFMPIEKPKPYAGKRILFMGDSITAANLNNNGWCKYFNEIMSPSLSVNVAVSGATWSDNENTVYNGNPSTHDQTNNTIGNQVEKIARGKDTTNPNYSHVPDYDDFDLIIISAGTNDNRENFNTDYIKDALVGSGNVPLSYSSINTKNAVGAMAYAYERLHTMYPDAKYFYCTPIQAYPVKKGWGEIQHKGSVMKVMCDYIPPLIIDSEKCGIFGNQEQYTSEGLNLADGLHPNAHGAKLLGVYNANAIINHLLAIL